MAKATKNLVIKFALSDGKTTSSLNIPDPREDVAKADVMAVAQDIIDKNVMYFKGMSITKVASISIDVLPVELA